LRSIGKWFIAYGIRMLALYLGFYFLYVLISFFNGFYPLMVFEANIIYQVMHIFYPFITLNGNIIGNLVLAGEYSSFAVSIDELCLGWFPMAGFASMILALPRIGRKKIAKSLLIGIPVLFVANLLRVIVVFFAAAFWGIDGFNFFHLFVVKVDLLLLIVAMFLICVKWVIGKPALLESLKAFSEEKEQRKRAESQHD